MVVAPFPRMNTQITTDTYNKELEFLKSALTLDNPFNSLAEIVGWIEERNREVIVNLERIELEAINNWEFDEKTQNLKHKSGNFFSIEGVNVKTNEGYVLDWDQPIINQPEIGFLGFVTKEFNGILYFLVQAKIEPGNVNNVQLSPTVQATKSNYTQVHGGKRPTYLEYFLDRKNNTILLDQLQSEQGARFLRKRNRNIIVKVSGDIPLYPDFRWMTLGQIKELIKEDNKVNMDTRTVISGIPFGNYRSDIVKFYTVLNNVKKASLGAKFLKSQLDSETALHTFDDIISWITHLKTFNELDVTTKPLSQVRNWKRTAYDIRHEEDKYFKVIGVNVQISNREVSAWHQPLIEPAQEGLCAYIVKEIKGILHFLVQAKVECGNFDTLEMAPTVQCLTGNYRNESSLATLPYLEYVLSIKKENIVFDTLQSEEGGRFFREQNRNLIIMADDNFEEELPAKYIWMTLNQMKSFIRFNNYLNIQARSLIAAITFNQ